MSLDKNTLAELSCTYAALILHDEGLEITGQQLSKLIEASGNKVDGFWPNIFAKSLKGQNISDLLCGGGAAPVQTSNVQASSSAAPVQQQETKKEAKKEEKVEEEEADYGMGLFDDM